MGARSGTHAAQRQHHRGVPPLRGPPVRFILLFLFLFFHKNYSPGYHSCLFPFFFVTGLRSIRCLFSWAFEGDILHVALNGLVPM